ncbi:MAG: hypothetical protein LBQ47_02530 [Endomicrobium sp.]|jgi:hypothetical protein|nr:hypothetical protein [Endomicrobium sp.]
MDKIGNRFISCGVAFMIFFNICVPSMLLKSGNAIDINSVFFCAVNGAAYTYKLDNFMKIFEGLNEKISGVLHISKRNKENQKHKNKSKEKQNNFALVSSFPPSIKNTKQLHNTLIDAGGLTGIKYFSFGNIFYNGAEFWHKIIPLFILFLLMWLALLFRDNLFKRLTQLNKKIENTYSI